MHVKGAVFLYKHQTQHICIVTLYMATIQWADPIQDSLIADNAHHSKGSRAGSSAGSSCQWSPSVYNKPQLSLTSLTLTHILWNSSQFAFVCYMFMTKSRSCAFGRDITEAMQSSHCIPSGDFDLSGFEDVHFDHLMKGVCVPGFSTVQCLFSLLL